jgi:hypothetical protein
MVIEDLISPQDCVIADKYLRSLRKAEDERDDLAFRTAIYVKNMEGQQYLNELTKRLELEQGSLKYKQSY